VKLTLLLLAALLAGAVIYPRYAEGTATVCAAFEHKLNMVAQAQLRSPAGLGGAHASDPKYSGLPALLAQIVASSQGALAQNYVQETYPNLPPLAGCVAAYWKLTADPDLTPYLRGRFGLKP
jgi:hypothetical protein